MSGTVSVRTVNTTPEEDTYSSLWINPSERTCGVEQKDFGDATPMDEYLDYILTYEIDEDNQRRIRSEAVKSYLVSPSAQILLNRVCEGWFTEYNGRNEVGDLDEDATSAIEELLSDISGLSCSEPFYEPSVTCAEEWVDESGSGVSALTTDDELVELSNEIEADAESQDVVIEDSVYDLLERWRDEAVEEWLDKARNAIEGDWDEDVAITHHPYDKTTLEVEFEFSDGTRGIVHISDEETKVIVAPETKERVN